MSTLRSTLDFYFNNDKVTKVFLNVIPQNEIEKETKYSSPNGDYYIYKLKLDSLMDILYLIHENFENKQNINFYKILNND